MHWIERNYIIFRSIYVSGAFFWCCRKITPFGHLWIKDNTYKPVETGGLIVIFASANATESVIRKQSRESTRADCLKIVFV